MMLKNCAVPDEQRVLYLHLQINVNLTYIDI
jgi:hypothetical protein